MNAFSMLLRRSQPAVHTADTSNLPSSRVMRSGFGTWLRRHRLRSALSLAAVAAMFAPGFAWAVPACVYNDAFNGPLNITMAVSGTYTVPRDMPVGTVIYSYPTQTPVGVTVLSCTETTGTYYVGSTTPPHGPQEATYKTYPTNIPGIGVRFMNPNNGSFYPQTSSYTQNGWWSAISATHEYVLQFVKVAPVTGSGIVQAADITAFTGQLNSNSGLWTYLNWIPAGSVQFINGTCITPDVAVDLGQHPKTEFTGVNAKTALVPFTIKLNSCPAGMTSIKYRIDPATTVQIPAQSVVALDATSTATGVGIQLLDGAGAVHPLGSGTDRLFSGYNPATGGDYTIPLQARYYQTSTSVTSGHANTTMTFTMTYQ